MYYGYFTDNDICAGRGFSDNGETGLKVEFPTKKDAYKFAIMLNRQFEDWYELCDEYEDDPNMPLSSLIDILSDVDFTSGDNFCYEFTDEKGNRIDEILLEDEGYSPLDGKPAKGNWGCNPYAFSGVKYKIIKEFNISDEEYDDEDDDEEFKEYDDYFDYTKEEHEDMILSNSNPSYPEEGEIQLWKDANSDHRGYYEYRIYIEDSDENEIVESLEEESFKWFIINLDKFLKKNNLVCDKDVLEKAKEYLRNATVENNEQLREMEGCYVKVPFTHA